MKEIEFRAWDKDLNYMWTPFDPVKFEEENLWNWDSVNDENCQFTFLQYTGLKDKNKTKIYEGDILEFTDKWEWYRGEWASKFLFAQSQEECRELDKQFSKLPTHKVVVDMSAEEGVNFSTYDLGEGRWEVIGNIYENKNLL